jgi:hypothetical protein
MDYHKIQIRNTWKDWSACQWRPWLKWCCQKDWKSAVDRYLGIPYWFIRAKKANKTQNKLKWKKSKKIQFVWPCLFILCARPSRESLLVLNKKNLKRTTNTTLRIYYYPYAYLLKNRFLWRHRDLRMLDEISLSLLLLYSHTKYHSKCSGFKSLAPIRERSVLSKLLV